MSDTDVAKFLLDDENLFLVIGGSIAIIAIVAGSLTSLIKSMARERTRREIAAYIAEGSMSPEQGERLMAANPDREGKC
jgi:hypothetical protein